jgi:hypothetical protein
LHEQKYNPETEIDESPLTNHFEDFMAANSELSDSKKRKLIKKKFMVDPPPDFIDFEKLNDSHFMMFILSLSNNNRATPAFSTHNSHRAGFNHLYTIYRKQKPPEVNSEISLYFKGLKK